MAPRIAPVFAQLVALSCAAACAPASSPDIAPSASADALTQADAPAPSVDGQPPEGSQGELLAESGGREPQGAPEGVCSWDDLGGAVCGPLRSAHAVRVLPPGGADEGSWSFTLLTDQRVTCDDIAESIQLEADHASFAGSAPTSPAAACKTRQEARMITMEAADLRGEYAGCAVRVDDRPDASPDVVVGDATESWAAAAFMAECDAVTTWEQLAEVEADAQAALAKATGGAVVWAEMQGRPTDPQGPATIEAVLDVTIETDTEVSEQRVAVQARLMDCVVQLQPAFDGLPLK